jgi:hypothetical protein
MVYWLNNAYYLNDIIIDFDELELIIYKTTLVIQNLLDLYYKRFLHLNKKYIFKIIDKTLGLKDINKKLELNNCEDCYYGKFKEIISRDP